LEGGKVNGNPPLPHLPIFSKRPILQPIASPPLPVLIMIFIPKLLPPISIPNDETERTQPYLDSNLIVRESKQLLPQPISILLGPFLAQKLHNSVGSGEEAVAITPDGVWSVCEWNLMGVSVGLIKSAGGKGGGSIEDYFVFQRSWAALTFFVAVSWVKGGRIPAIVTIYAVCLSYGVLAPSWAFWGVGIYILLIDQPVIVQTIPNIWG
jgi:hypothetical protein